MEPVEGPVCDAPTDRMNVFGQHIRDSFQGPGFPSRQIDRCFSSTLPNLCNQKKLTPAGRKSNFMAGWRCNPPLGGDTARSSGPVRGAFFDNPLWNRLRAELFSPVSRL